MVFTKFRLFSPAVLITCLLVLSLLGSRTRHDQPGRFAHCCQRSKDEAQGWST